MKITYFCKKGGVGKTTVSGEHAGYLASLGHKVLVISIDDQNSIFEAFGMSSLVYNREDNFIEHLIAGQAKKEDVIIPLRDNIYGVKTLNTDMLSKKLTLERLFEKEFIKTLDSLRENFDDVIFDLPPSSNRTNELVLEYVDFITLIVELSKLGTNGFYNTLQYFMDSGIEFGKIKYILPNGFSKSKSVPAVALDELKVMVSENLSENVKVLPCLPEKSAIKALQNKGVLVFDLKSPGVTQYVRTCKKEIRADMEEIYKQVI